MTQEEAVSDRGPSLKMPQHVALYIEHNDHKTAYDTAESWVANNDPRAHWVSDDERAKAIAEDSIWTVQVYPRTPLASYFVAASTLEAALEYLAKEEG